MKHSPQASKCLVVNSDFFFYLVRLEGDVLAGKDVFGIHHAGILEGWFGEYWWNTRTFVLLITTLLVFAPLTSFKRIGKYLCFTSISNIVLHIVP